MPIANKPAKKKSLASYSNNLTLSYNWRCDDIQGEMPAALREILNEKAEERAFEMRKKGYREGELLECPYLKIKGLKTPTDGFYCRGWFEFKES